MAFAGICVLKSVSECNRRQQSAPQHPEAKTKSCLLSSFGMERVLQNAGLPVQLQSKERRGKERQEPIRTQAKASARAGTPRVRLPAPDQPRLKRSPCGSERRPEQ